MKLLKQILITLIIILIFDLIINLIIPEKIKKRIGIVGNYSLKSDNENNYKILGRKFT